MEIRKIPAKDTLPLRSSVLWPGAAQFVDVPGDESAYHFGVFFSGINDPVSVISLFIDDIPEGKPTDSDDISGHSPPTGLSARFRKFATHPDFQSKGIGTQLLSFTCDFASTRLKAERIWCSARTFSLDWYRKRGLEAIGECWMKGGHEYVKMVKEL